MSNTETVANEEVKSLRNFRNSADVENFYRFIHENDLREEATLILSTLYKKMTAGQKKKRKTRKNKKLH